MKADTFTVPWEATDEQMLFIHVMREEVRTLAQQEARAETVKALRAALVADGIRNIGPALRALLEGK